MPRRKLSEEQQRWREASDREWQRRDYARQLAERLERKQENAQLQRSGPVKKRIPPAADPMLNC